MRQKGKLQQWVMLLLELMIIFSVNKCLAEPSWVAIANPKFDDTIESLTIIRESGDEEIISESQEIRLWAGDKIETRCSLEETNIYPSEKVMQREIDGGYEYTIVDKKSETIINNIWEAFKFIFGASGDNNTGMSESCDSRGNEGYNYYLYPRPCYNSSLLLHEQVGFAWKKDYAELRIVDGNRKVLFSKKLQGENSLSLIPNNIKLQEGELYYWELVDNENTVAHKYRMNVLKNDYEQEINKVISWIDSLNKNAEEKALLKARFMQKNSGQGIDLYWLSYKYLAPFLSEGHSLGYIHEVDELLNTYAKHLGGERKNEKF